MAESGRSGDEPAGADPILSTIVRNLPVVLFALDASGTFTRSEGRGLDALGLEPNEVVGESVFDVYADHPSVLEPVERALDGEAVHRVVEVDGTAFEAWYRPTEGGGVLGVAIDVTDRLNHERRLERLNEATRELVVAESEREVADRIVEICRRVLDEPASVVWLLDADDGVLVPVAGVNPTSRRGSPDWFFRDLAPIGPDTAEMAAFRRGEAAFFEDYGAVEDAAHPDADLGAILAAPIGEYGLLTVGAPSAAEIGSSTPDLVEILARDAAVALDRVRREAAVEGLHAATRDLIEAETREEIARRTVGAAEDILGHPQSVFRLRSADGSRLEPVAMTDWIDETIPNRPTFEVGEGPVGTAFERGEPMAFDRSELSGAMSHASTRTLLCVPVGRYGVLSIGKPEAAGFDDAERRLVMILAANAESAFDRIDRELRLERQNERLEGFAEIVSHDLRNPLNIVAGHLDVAEDGRANLSAMRAAVERMEVIIEDVLELAREGRAVTEEESLDLGVEARTAWGTIETGDATLAVEADRRISADPARLRRLLENLFRNAVEHGGDGVAVRVGTTPGGFYVEDDGPGIPADRREDVFELGRSLGEEGTGIGLAIVDEIAEAHGWTVSATTGRDGGARIEVGDVAPG